MAKNKYAAQSRAAQRHRIMERGCKSKRAYPTREAAAAQKGNDVYQCKFCHQWHRTGAIAALANTMAKRNRRLD